MDLLLAALPLLLGQAASSQDEDSGVPALEKRITFQSTGNLPELLDQFWRATGANLFLDPRAQAAVEADRKTTITLKGVKGSSVLRWIAERYGLEVVTREGVATIDEPQRSRPSYLRTYNTRSLPRPTHDGIGPQIILGAENTWGIVLSLTEMRDTNAGDDLVTDLIKESVAPGTWDGQATIELTPGQNHAVNATAAVHTELASFLESLAAFHKPQVAVTADVWDADPEIDRELLAPGALSILGSDAAAALAERIRNRLRRSCEIHGADGQRVFAFATQENTGVIAYDKGEPVVGNWVSDTGILDVRPVLSANGQTLSLELRFGMGVSRDLNNIALKRGALPIRELLVTRLTTNLQIPNGGGAIVGLPSVNPSNPRPQLCLLRARAAVPDTMPPKARLFSSSPDSADLRDRLENAAPADVDLTDAPFEDFAEWLRRATGLNVLFDAAAGEKRITAKLRGVPPARVLQLTLPPAELSFTLRHEAIFISGNPSKRPSRTAILDARDLAWGPQDFPIPSEEAQSQFTESDLANALKNNVHKDQWEEGEGRSLQVSDGLIIVRNTEPVIQDCIRFLEDRRRHSPPSLAIIAEMLSVPSETAAAVLGDGKSSSHPLEGKEVARLVAAGTRLERLAWNAQDGQRTSLSWERARNYVADYSDDDPVDRTHRTASYFEARPALEKDGRTIRLDLRYEDVRISEMKERTVKQGVVQSPVNGTTSVRTSIAIPENAWAALRWTEPGSPARTRLLLVKASVLPVR